MEDAATQQQQSEQVENRNLWTLAIQNVVLRVGWIFKTESVIMPYVVDAISGAGWIRGLLPILSRVGQSVPPLLYADHLRSQPLKKIPLFLTAIGMAVPFLILGGIWNQLEDRRVWWMVTLFLVLYFIFFSMTGLNQLVFGTLQGKLVRPNRRGLLLGVGGILGSVFAVSTALFWLEPWITMPDFNGFCPIFLFNGSAFLVAGIVALFCIEHRDEKVSRPKVQLIAPFQNAWRIYRTDKAFRRSAYVAMLFISSLLVFPHYQWLGREKIGTDESDLIFWVIVQNISVGLYSPGLGKIADNYGNRLAIRVGVIAVAFTPVIAVLFASGLIENAKDWYWLTFVLLGLTPVIMRTILNYSLELVDESEHPQYLSTMRIVFAVPFLFSPIVGILIDTIPYQVPFIGVGLLVFVGGFLTFRMEEPRDKILSDEV